MARDVVGVVLDRIAAASGVAVIERRDLIAQAWQAHVHYWDLLVDADRLPDRDIPTCLDAMYAQQPVAVALAYGSPGLHGQLRQLLGHFDPTRAAPGTIRGDLGDDSFEAALAERRLVHNLVHTSDDPTAARRDFGTWYGAARRALLTPPLPHRTTPDHTGPILIPVPGGHPCPYPHPYFRADRTPAGLRGSHRTR